MNKIKFSSSLVVPGGTASVLYGEETVPNVMVIVDPSKAKLPRGIAEAKTEATASKDASRGHIRVYVPCLGKDGLTTKAVTATITLTTERDALRGGEKATLPNGNIADNASGASLVALRLAVALAMASVKEGGTSFGGLVVLDNSATNDPTGLLSSLTDVRFSNPFVRGQLGLPMVPNDTVVGGTIDQATSEIPIAKLDV